MGSSCWTEQSLNASVSRMGFKSVDAVTNASVQEVFKSRNLCPELDPHDVIRECCDSEEHPNTIPLIISLDVTGSMGEYAQKCLTSLNDIISDLYKNIEDVEIMTMGIGDLAYDLAPLQVSQFESDERIADQLFKIWIEGGGGGNSHESYAAAWYFGLNATKLDCSKRGKRGIIITIGDENCPPSLPIRRLKQVMGKTVHDQADVNVKDLYNEASKKFDIFHLSIKEGFHYRLYSREVDDSWKKVIGQNYSVVSANDLASAIVTIVKDCANNVGSMVVEPVSGSCGIAW